METAVPTLLTIGLPAAPKAGGKAGAPLLTVLGSVENAAETSVAARFADVLVKAEQTLRSLGIERLAITAAGGTDTTKNDEPARAAFFKRLAEALDAQVVAAIMPPSSYPIEATPWQESFAAAVAFDPELRLSDVLAETAMAHVGDDVQGMRNAGVDMLPVLSAVPSTMLDVASQTSLETVAGSFPAPAVFDPVEAATTTVEGKNMVVGETAHVLVVQAETIAQAVEMPKALTAPQIVSISQTVAIQSAVQPTLTPRVTEASLVAARTTVAVPPVRTLTPLSTPIALEASAEEGTQEFFNPEAFREFSLKERPSVARERREVPISVLARTIGLEPEQVATVGEQDLELLPEGEGMEEHLKAPAHSRGTYGSVGEVLRIAESRGMAYLAPSEQVAVRIVQAKHTKAEKITITLHPAELGKVEVQMRVEADNGAMVKITADSREAFDVLRADRIHLERILQDSGLKLDNGALEFGYRGSENNAESSSEHDFNGHGSGNKEGNETMTREQEAGMQEVDITSHIALSVTTGVNIRV